MDIGGIYLLGVRLRRQLAVEFGKKAAALPPGFYVYAGSAKGGLAGRLGRHLRFKSSQGRPHWHVDKLLAAGEVFDVQALPDEPPLGFDECGLAREVRGWAGAAPLAGFGASDCRCGSHLAYFANRPGFTPFSGGVARDFPRVIEVFRRLYIDHVTSRREPFETLVTCLLSLRTQDPVTAVASRRLFARVSSPAEFAAADPELVAELIFPVGMYRRKAENLVALAGRLLDKHGGAVPSSIEELLELPGVGRKTANLVRSFAFHLPAICVDTHAHRIANRLGLVRTAAPDDTEAALRQVLPEEFWTPFNPFMVQHGQQICRPIRPKCGICPIREWCHYHQVVAGETALASLPEAPGHPSLGSKGKAPPPGDANPQAKPSPPWECPFPSSD